jgi:hypothetical protein
MPEATETDRRRSPRTKADGPVTLVVDTDRSRIANSAFALDFSCLGARVRTAIDLKAGQLVIVIPKKGEAVPSRVVWIGQKQASERTSEVGLAFLHPVAVGG